ncbi:prenyltransferase/squalene oxidase repeat-containing protein [Tunturiibacter psychrotolerans]|uniref:prenyltransferase/squalene oxidase repeat-containing protein n=1 Tax=Tunturiibacter psychrotolerans TaxID=3069686 RepID=UPI003D1BA0B5
MDWEKVAQIYESYFQLQDLRNFEERLSRPFVWGSLTLDHTHASQFAVELNRLGLEAGLEKGLLQERVAKRVLDLERLKTIDANTPKATAKARERQTGRVQNPFHDFVTEEIRKLGDKIKAIPTNVEKSSCALKTLLKTREWVLNDELLDVIVFMRKEISDDLIQDVIADWTKDRNKNIQDPVRPLSSIFWSAPSGKFVEWGVSRYRFAEHFDVGGFEDAFSDFERELSGLLSEDVGSSGIRSLCFDLLMMSRSSKLTVGLSDEIEIVLKRVYESAEDEKWEEAEVRPGSPYKVAPSVATTAVACLAILRLSTSDSQKKLAVAAAKWLLQQQTNEGAWCTDFEVNAGIKKQPDVFITVVICEALARAGLPGISHALKSAKSWLMSQQNEIGFWQEDGFNYSLCTVIVLEALNSLQSLPSIPTDPYFIAAQGFLRRSFRFLREDNPTSRRLAVIAAHQGLESLLYSFLNHEQKKIWRDHAETIGFREALKVFQEHLKFKKLLNVNEIIPYRSQLESLAHLRDEIIHKAADVTEASVRPLIEVTWHFASKYSREILKVDLLY